MNSYDITKQLFSLFDNFEYKLQNTYVFHWESDFFCIAKSSKYVYEIEVKISKYDFKNDFKKHIGYHNNSQLKHDFLVDKNQTFKPHKFFFACPEGLIMPEDIPNQYGLIWVSKNRAYYKKNPKFLHKEDLFNNKHFLKQMLSKFYHRFLDIKHEQKLRMIDIKFNQARLYDEWNY